MSYCDDILARSRTLHLDECEVVSIQKKITTVRITDSEIAEIKQNQENSVAVRVIDKKRIISGMTSGDEKNFLERVLETRMFVKPKNFWKTLPFPSKFSQVKKTYDPRLENITGHAAADMANEMINASTHKYITRISGSLNIVSEKFHVMNTNGIDCSDDATFISATINTDSQTGDQPVSGIGASCTRTLDDFSAHGIGNDSREMCIGSTNPKKIEPDSYDIIFEPYAFGELLAFVVSANFGLKTYSEKRSCFSDRLGNKVSSENFTLSDDPHSPEGIGSKSFDDEGTPTVPQFFIKSGIFSGLYSDSFEAFKNGKISSGNAARPGSPMGRQATPLPVPRTHNIKVTEGDFSKDEIVKNTKKGILVGRLWYTYPVNPEQGDFSCTARSGIKIIENGVASPARPVRIVHNIKTLLQNISAVGDDSKNILQWGSIPAITPTIRADSIQASPL
ncbi:TldD/PmbA family protein [Candidatus Nitrosotalea okcheonensis]|uniref:Peptidase U62 modulator of DNA gyrase n=1 Tax=Candidatus Nitrosotalea okcheonensis TaxID=1903276 RepID=A0A2H1FFC7_9ARCH|nr:TldD/PmbA family protein [Candidatus Nitrosotalea okcheonensis]SMH71379.1 Peptidase U62 modulator of DNA gyrase [Candidatus Nitrosotalea okcheonensis]